MARRVRKHSRKSHKMSGGQYSSAASYQMHVNGPLGAQYGRVFDQSGAYGQLPGNVIIGAQGQNVLPSSQIPTAAQMNLVQSAGKRRSKSRSRRSRRGGFLGAMVNQAIVPFSILGMQQTYRRKRSPGKQTRRR